MEGQQQLMSCASNPRHSLWDISLGFASFDDEIMGLRKHRQFQKRGLFFSYAVRSTIKLCCKERLGGNRRIAEKQKFDKSQHDKFQKQIENFKVFVTAEK